MIDMNPILIYELVILHYNMMGYIKFYILMSLEVTTLNQSLSQFQQQHINWLINMEQEFHSIR